MGGKDGNDAGLCVCVFILIAMILAGISIGIGDAIVNIHDYNDDLRGKYRLATVEVISTSNQTYGIATEFHWQYNVSFSSSELCVDCTEVFRDYAVGTYHELFMRKQPVEYYDENPYKHRLKSDDGLILALVIMWGVYGGMVALMWWASLLSN